MWLCGLGDPLLWGATAPFLLNYIPIIGPLAGVAALLRGRRAEPGLAVAGDAAGGPLFC